MCPIHLIWADFFFFTVVVGEMFIPESCETHNLDMLDVRKHLCIQIPVLALLGFITDV